MWFINDTSLNEDEYKVENAPLIQQAWLEYFGAAGLGPVPHSLVAPSNSKFLVTAPAILRRPRSFYEGAIRFLMTTEMLSIKAGLAREYLWAEIFTGSAHVDPAQYDCLCVLYGICLPSPPTTLALVGPVYVANTEQWPEQTPT